MPFYVVIPPHPRLAPHVRGGTIISTHPTQQEAERQARPVVNGVPVARKIIEAPDDEAARELASRAFGFD